MSAWTWFICQLQAFRPHKWDHLQGVPADRCWDWVTNDQLDECLKVHRKY